MVTFTILKRAIVKALVDDGLQVVSLDTTEAYEKPAYFVNLMPSKVTRITPFIDSVEINVEIQYEPKTFTNAAVLEAIDRLDRIFAKNIKVEGDRVITAPIEINVRAEENVYLYYSFGVTLTRKHDEYSYDKSDSRGDAYMDTLETNWRK